MSNLQKIRTRNFKLINLLTILVWFGCVCLYSQDNRHKTNADTFTRPFSQCWDFFVNQNPEIEFASDNVKELFLPTLDGKLVALNYNYGEKLWETDLGGEIISTPLSDADRVYIAVSYDNNQNDDPVMISKKEGVDKRTGNQRRTVIRSLDKTTGLTYWESEFQFDFTSEKKLYLYPFRKFLVLVADNGDVHSIDKSSGQIVWKKRLRLNFSSIPFQEEEKIFFGVSDKRLVSLSLATGEIIRGINTVSPPTAVVNDKIRGNLIWGDKRGTIYSFDTESRKFNWYFRKGAEISSIVFTERGILTTSLDNFIYLNSYKKGQLIWKKRLDGRLVAKPLVDGNFTVVTSISDPVAVIIELGSGKVVNNIALETDNLFTGGYVKVGDLLLYSTLRGVFAFSQKANCQLAVR